MLKKKRKNDFDCNMLRGKKKWGKQIIFLLIPALYSSRLGGSSNVSRFLLTVIKNVNTFLILKYYIVYPLPIW